MSADGVSARIVCVLLCEDDEQLGDRVADGLRTAGFTVDLTRTLTDAAQQCGALLITARDSPADRSEGSAGGVDDFLAKPFSLSELAGRVRALCAPRRSPASPPLTVGDLVVDRLRRRVRRAGVLLTMTTREFSALELLAARAGTLVSATEIAVVCGDAAVDQVIAKLDRKLGPPRILHASAAGYLLHA
ncbi:response regulator transcription factor [Nocardia tengchongensis]|uniref:response regulator transcription factor n=1 Tax=Nocardia tengchongensis TaxID=2055889 RepID=UPI003617D27E